MTQICVSLTEPGTDGIIDQMADLADVADLFEIRGDLVRDLDLLTILRAKTRPLLFSCRPVSEGGRWPDSDPSRRLKLLEAAKRGFDFVDVELDSAFLEVMAEKAGNGLIVSRHDLEGTPEDLDELYAKMSETGADFVKIVVTPHSIRDVGRLLEFASRAAASGGPPLIPIALGQLGILTRVVAGRFGAPFTYASAREGAEAAPGQLPAAVMADVYRARRVKRATKLYGVLGGDVGASLSPLLYNRAFEARGLDAVYVPLQAEAVEPFVEALDALGLAGFSVTNPFKTEIVSHLQEVDEPAALCGSVNTVEIHEGVLRGSTTDGVGVVSPLKKRIELKGRSVVIVGAGGAARAAALALLRKGASVTVVARDPDSAAFVAASVQCEAEDLAELGSLSWDVLINATPVGSSRSPDETPVPAGLHRSGTVVLDMVYDPPETRLLREAAEAGCTVIGGIEMLVAQAKAQFETWTGLEAPADVMEAAAREDGATVISDQ
jgi:3-dehydroquinate dehydratase/shikimate dehydrogenase